MDDVSVHSGGSAAQQFKVCVKCGVTKPIGDFRRYKPKKPFYTVSTAESCKKCSSAALRRAKLDPDDKRSYDQKWTERNRNNISGKAATLLQNARTRALKKDKVVTLTHQYVKSKLEDGRCEATGFKFAMGETEGRGRIMPFAASIDCIEPQGGYTKENTQFVCSMYNIGKNRHAEIDFKAMCLAVALRNMDDPAVHDRMRELMGKGQHVCML